MQHLQQTVFKNLNSQTPYNFSSKKLTQKHQSFPKYRYQQIQNQFEVVDLHDTGYLSENQIVQYLSDKYEWVNLDVLKALFSKMDWVRREDIDEIKSKYDEQNNKSKLREGNRPHRQYVEKNQFCNKYLERQKNLYHQINGLRYYPQWVRTLEEIYREEMRMGTPRAYFYFQIQQIDLYHEGRSVQWMDIRFTYQNHERRVEYQIQQASHQAKHNSFQIWLPSQKDSFFLKFQFMDMTDSKFIYGQCFFSIQLSHKMQKRNKVQLPVVKSGKKVGNCKIMYRLESSSDVVRDQLTKLKQQQNSYEEIIYDKTKQYQYLQFLWGVRHKSPQKISKIDTTWMLALRLAIIVFMGLIGLCCNVLGRCEPISLVLTFILLKNYNIVLHKIQIFTITWIGIAGIFIDLVWLTIAAQYKSQINFIDLGPAKTLTYFLLVVKVLLFLYMIIVEKAFRSQYRNQN